MNVNSWLTAVKTTLKSADPELILLNAIDPSLDRSWLVTHGDYILSEAEARNADDGLKRRTAGEPLAYILGYKDFYGFDFLVDKSVLIPRPETEEAIDLIKDLNPGSILDVGTGSGCIAITLQALLPDATVEASDIEKKDLFFKNSQKILGKDLPFYQSDLLSNISKNYDVIVANLPYVDKNWDWLDKTLDFEPSNALYADDNGLALIKRLIIEAKDRAKYLVLESDTSQQPEIIKFAKENNYTLFKQSGFYLVFKY